jgi:dinuclear metal center YbgI/SA1388 family protein
VVAGEESLERAIVAGAYRCDERVVVISQFGQCGCRRGYRPHLRMSVSDARVACSEVIGFLDELLKPQVYDDYGPNGLQIPGSDTITTLVSGVSANLELFEQARGAGAQLVLVHHGLIWGGPPQPLDRFAKARLQVLFDADIGLAAYHLPLDAHLEHGNNALLAGALGAGAVEPFARFRGTPIGVRARFEAEGVDPEELVRRVAAATGREPLAFTDGPDRVRSIGIVSGGGADHLEDAIAEGLDAFVTGEPAERSMALAREAGVHFLAAGHYATETFGVRRLGDLVARRFGIRHVYVDVPNPI